MSLVCQGWAPVVSLEAGTALVGLVIPLHLLRVSCSRGLGVSSLSLQSQAGEPRSSMRLTHAYTDSACLTTLSGRQHRKRSLKTGRNLPYVHPQSR